MPHGIIQTSNPIIAMIHGFDIPNKVCALIDRRCMIFSFSDLQFVGTEKQCEQNIKNYPNTRIEYEILNYLT